MRDLNFDLKRLQQAHDDGSHGTRTARSYALAQMADLLHELGFKGLMATGLRRKHAVALVKEWKRQGRSIGTMKNRTAHLRWWATRIGRPGVVPSNGELGIANRQYVTNEDKSIVLDPEKLAVVKDSHVVMALRLEAAFGLRREEAIKFTPARDDWGDRVRLKGSTTKGGRPREVPVRNEAQRRLLDEARRRVGSGALIPSDRNYRQQLKVYESQTREAGLYRMHGPFEWYGAGQPALSIRIRGGPLAALHAVDSRGRERIGHHFNAIVSSAAFCSGFPGRPPISQAVVDADGLLWMFDRHGGLLDPCFAQPGGVQCALNQALVLASARFAGTPTIFESPFAVYDLWTRQAMVKLISRFSLQAVLLLSEVDGREGLPGHVVDLRASRRTS